MIEAMLRKHQPIENYASAVNRTCGGAGVVASIIE